MDHYQHTWNEYKVLLRQWRLNHREYAPQIIKIQKHFESLELECSKFLIEYRRSKKQIYIDKADALLESAGKQIKTISKFEFLATLSK